MQTIFELFDKLTDQDVTWILSMGAEQRFAANAFVIREGEHPESIYIVLEGLLAVSGSLGAGESPVTRGPGEMIGKMAFLEDRPASETVTAVEDSLLLALSRKVLAARLAEDTAFAARLYRAVAIVFTRLLSRGEHISERTWHDKTNQEPAPIPAWEPIAKTVAEFKMLLARAEREGLKNHNQVPEQTEKEVRAAFRELFAYVNVLLGDGSSLTSQLHNEMGARLQNEMLPYLLLTTTAERVYSKPRGYAGDYLSIEMIYQNHPSGSGRLGPLMDKCFHEMPAAAAVRNRRGLLAEEISHVIEQGGPTTHITSLACGPARELFDVFRTLKDPARLSASLIDIDLQALAFVADHRDRANLQRQMKLINSNLVYLALGREKIALRDQDLVYSIGLIDYFNDKIVVKLLDFIHGILRTGGKVILGNFHPRNPSKALMDHVLDWKLIHRTEEDMNRLLASSAFRRPCTDIRFEEQGINLFAACVKA